MRPLPLWRALPGASPRFREAGRAPAHAAVRKSPRRGITAGPDRVFCRRMARTRADRTLRSRYSAQRRTIDEFFRLRVMAQALPFLLIAPGHAPGATGAMPRSAARGRGGSRARQPPTAVFAAADRPDARADRALPRSAADPGADGGDLSAAGRRGRQWLEDPANAELQGDALVAALEPLPWDPSVKSLVAFPQIIVMMTEHIEWTQALGVAFGASRSRRWRGCSFCGTAPRRPATSNPMPRSSTSTGAASGLSSRPSRIRSTCRSTTRRWSTGPGPTASTRRSMCRRRRNSSGAGFNLGPGIGFSVGFGVVAPLWGWGHPDWRRHEVVVDQNRYGRITRRDRDPENHIRIENNTWHRTAPVVTVVAPTRERPREENTRRPQGTAAPASVRAPAPSNARPAATPTQAAPGANAPNRERSGPTSRIRPRAPRHRTPRPPTGSMNASGSNEPHPAPGTAAPNTTAPNREHERERSNEPHPAPGTAAPNTTAPNREMNASGPTSRIRPRARRPRTLRPPTGRNASGPMSAHPAPGTAAPNTTTPNREMNASGRMSRIRRRAPRPRTRGTHRAGQTGHAACGLRAPRSRAPGRAAEARDPAGGECAARGRPSPPIRSRPRTRRPRRVRPSRPSPRPSPIHRSRRIRRPPRIRPSRPSPRLSRIRQSRPIRRRSRPSRRAPRSPRKRRTSRPNSRAVRRARVGLARDARPFS